MFSELESTTQYVLPDTGLHHYLMADLKDVTAPVLPGLSTLNKIVLGLPSELFFNSFY